MKKCFKSCRLVIVTLYSSLRNVVVVYHGLRRLPIRSVLEEQIRQGWLPVADHWQQAVHRMNNYFDKPYGQADKNFVCSKNQQNKAYKLT